jgi:hypothetical protein
MTNQSNIEDLDKFLLIEGLFNACPDVLTFVHKPVLEAGIEQT